jgi:hypothetical protein
LAQRFVSGLTHAPLNLHAIIWKLPSVDCPWLSGSYHPRSMLLESAIRSARRARHARPEPFAKPRAGRLGLGSLASSICTTAHPLHTRFTNIFGVSLSEATMWPNPMLGAAPRYSRCRCRGRAPRGGRRRPSRRRRVVVPSATRAPSAAPGLC